MNTESPSPAEERQTSATIGVVIHLLAMLTFFHWGTLLAGLIIGAIDRPNPLSRAAMFAGLNAVFTLLAVSGFLLLVSVLALPFGLVLIGFYAIFWAVCLFISALVATVRTRAGTPVSNYFGMIAFLK